MRRYGEREVLVEDHGACCYQGEEGLLMNVRRGYRCLPLFLLSLLRTKKQEEEEKNSVDLSHSIV